jgi:hypothetical protein
VSIYAMHILYKNIFLYLRPAIMYTDQGNGHNVLYKTVYIQNTKLYIRGIYVLMTDQSNGDNGLYIRGI